jgi:predicted TIM-barrel fold metal-dependent hydrolase
LLGLARSARVAVKLSGFQKFSALPPPFDDTRPFLEALLDSFTPDACVWASDWPFLRAPQRLDVGPQLRQIAQLLPDEADRRKVFWDTPRRLLGF